LWKAGAKPGIEWKYVASASNIDHFRFYSFISARTILLPTFHITDQKVATIATFQGDFGRAILRFNK
jgi:hypothetical protein